MKRATLLSAATPLAVAAAAILAVGDLNPPAGAVTETGKRLAEVEPRIAISATNTPGDADSTFRISQPGSYYLTGNVVGIAGRHGIEIAASSVTLDLGGFNVDGSGVGSGFDGIRTSVNAQNIAIVNGSLSNWSADGIDLQTISAVNGSIERVDVSFVSGIGVRTGTNFAVERCKVRSVQIGFSGGEGCTLESCAAHDVLSAGFSGGIGWTLNNCAATNCAGGGFAGLSASAFNACTAAGCNGGFLLFDHNTLSDCVAVGNIGGTNKHGISVNFDSVIRGCIANGNAGNGIVASFSSILDCTANLNWNSGIVSNGVCLVRGNTCASNGTAGAAAGIVANNSDSHIEGNSCTRNTGRGIDVNAAGNIIVRNTCSGNTVSNWDIAANNVFGPIVDRSAPASAAVLGNSAASSLGSTDANANFSY